MRYLEIEPARAKSKDPTSFWGDPSYYAEPKLDGWRFLMHFCDGLDRVYLTGRRTSSVTGLLSEKGLCAPQLWPENRSHVGYTVIDGEVMPPDGAEFGDIAGIMNADPAEALRRASEIGPPRYVAFDLLFWDGDDWRDVAQGDRKQRLEEVVSYVGNPLISVAQTLEPLESAYDEIVGSGGEGVMLKNRHARYDTPGAWIKVKRYSTLDVVVTGFTEARFGRTGKYHGLIGAVKIGVYACGELVEVGQVSGMDDDLRKDLSENRSSWIGRVIEVRAQEFAVDRLRHPRWFRARPDADPRSCTFDKMCRDLQRPKIRGEKQLDLFR